MPKQPGGEVPLEQLVSDFEGAKLALIKLSPAFIKQGPPRSLTDIARLRMQTTVQFITAEDALNERFVTMEIIEADELKRQRLERTRQKPREIMEEVVRSITERDLEMLEQSKTSGTIVLPKVQREKRELPEEFPVVESPFKIETLEDGIGLVKIGDVIIELEKHQNAILQVIINNQGSRKAVSSKEIVKRLKTYKGKASVHSRISDIRKVFRTKGFESPIITVKRGYRVNLNKPLNPISHVSLEKIKIQKITSIPINFGALTFIEKDGMIQSGKARAHLTPLLFRVVKTIRELNQSGPVSTTRLAKAMNIDPQTTSSFVSQAKKILRDAGLDWIITSPKKGRYEFNDVVSPVQSKSPETKRIRSNELQPGEVRIGRRIVALGQDNIIVNGEPIQLNYNEFVLLEALINQYLNSGAVKKSALNVTPFVSSSELANLIRDGGKKSKPDVSSVLEALGRRLGLTFKYTREDIGFGKEPLYSITYVAKREEKVKIAEKAPLEIKVLNTVQLMINKPDATPINIFNSLGLPFETNRLTNKALEESRQIRIQLIIGIDYLLAGKKLNSVESALATKLKRYFSENNIRGQWDRHNWVDIRIGSILNFAEGAILTSYLRGLESNLKYVPFDDKLIERLEGNAGLGKIKTDLGDGEYEKWLNKNRRSVIDKLILAERLLKDKRKLFEYFKEFIPNEDLHLILIYFEENSEKMESYFTHAALQKLHYVVDYHEGESGRVISAKVK